MSELLVLVIFLAIGYFSGILVGLMGIGGGLVFVPVLYYFLPLFNIPQDQLAYFVIGLKTGWSVKGERDVSPEKYPKVKTQEEPA